jgi:predicted metal-dependent enzyme (double-stranded beta helix superfamily)
MRQTHPHTLASLIERLDGAIERPDPSATAQAVKQELVECGAELAGLLPERFFRADEHGYARRLLHRGDDYTVVVMTWGPGQATGLHDHAGIWCVECVVAGALEVSQFDLVEERAGLYRFEPQRTVLARVGDAGCLIPPFEYHVLANALPDATSITLHVYGGEMDHCNTYQPTGTGWWRASSRRLAYTA